MTANSKALINQASMVFIVAGILAILSPIGGEFFAALGPQEARTTLSRLGTVFAFSAALLVVMCAVLLPISYLRGPASAQTSGQPANGAFLLSLFLVGGMAWIVAGSAVWMAAVLAH